MGQIIDFITAMTGERFIEIAAVILGLINVTLLIKRSIWNYPFGILMVSLYAYIFYGAKLYSEVLLQIYFFFMQIYGWYYWAKGKVESDDIVVKVLDKKQYPLYFLTAITGIFLVGSLMRNFTDASLPFLDASVAVLSVIAQFMLARRYLENWLVWIFVDILAIGIYWHKDLYPTSVLYSIFLILATTGFISWYRARRSQVSAL